MTTALELAQKQAEREANGTPETLADIIVRARFAAEWNQRQAESCAKVSDGFWKMTKDERYTERQREDAIYSAAYEQGRVAIYRDASRTLDSIADALVHVVGTRPTL